MSAGAVIAIGTVLFGWALLARRLKARSLTGPVVFMGAGLLLANPSWGLVTVDVDSAVVHTLAEVTLGLVLFCDASTVPLAAARRDLSLTVRLLGLALPLSMLAGVGLATVLLPTLPLALACVVAAALAPTDAALSAPIIADGRLPGRLRRLLNVESGLNDGIAAPVVTFCIASAAGVLGIAGHSDGAGFGAVGQLAIAAGVGAAMALVGGGLQVLAHRRGWMDHGSRHVATLALALLTSVVASVAGGNPFVAAFVGGLVFGAVAGDDTVRSVDLAELGGSLLSLVVWFVFGATVVLPAFQRLDARTIAYAVGSLSVVRMVPVAIALIGTGIGRSWTIFLGWFGPRGMASVVFALLAVEELGDADPRVRAAVLAIAVTVVFSVVAHGLSARPRWRRRAAAAFGNSASSGALERATRRR